LKAHANEFRTTKARDLAKKSLAVRVDDELQKGKINESSSLVNSIE
jgi:hypothetical protein